MVGGPETTLASREYGKGMNITTIRKRRNPENMEASSKVTLELRAALIETIEALRSQLKQIDYCIAALEPLNRFNPPSPKERSKTKPVPLERSIRRPRKA
jgi:hypothetical protein